MEEQKNIVKERLSSANETIQSTDEQRGEEREKNPSKSHNNEVKKNQKKLANDRKSQLLEWKAEKERKKQLETKKKKPTFQTFGVPRHKFYSPPTRVLSNKFKMNIKKRVSGNRRGRKSSTGGRLSSSRLEKKQVVEAPLTSSQTLTTAPKEELKATTSSISDDGIAPQTPTTDPETSTEFETSSSSSLSSPSSSSSSTTSDTSTLSMEITTSTCTLESKLATTLNPPKDTTGLMNPVIAKVHQSLVLQENKNLQDIRVDWSEIQKEYELPADDIRYINSVIGQMNYLIRRESNRFTNVIAGYQAGVQVFIRGRDYPRL